MWDLSTNNRNSGRENDADLKLNRVSNMVLISPYPDAIVNFAELKYISFTQLLKFRPTASGVKILRAILRYANLPS